MVKLLIILGTAREPSSITHVEELHLNQKNTTKVDSSDLSVTSQCHRMNGHSSMGGGEVTGCFLDNVKGEGSKLL